MTLSAPRRPINLCVRQPILLSAVRALHDHARLIRRHAILIVWAHLPILRLAGVGRAVFSVWWVWSG
jgi:hypothetical protein